MTELSTYTLRPLRKEAEFVFYRGWRDAAPSHVLVVAPVSEQPAPGTLSRLEDEYDLRNELHPAWAARPLALVRDKGHMALVLDDPGGEPLDRLLERPLELTPFLRIAIGLAGAVGKLHERDIVHKDIKPANLLVDPISGQVWLTGFGVASHLPRERQLPEPPESIAGTLAYMAPEQTGRMNRSIDSRSDLYCVGVTLYETLTGVLPFTASDPIEWVHCHLARQPAPPAELRKEVPEGLSAIVMKLLAKTPEERYQTAAGLEADLAKCLAGWRSFGRIDPFLLGAHDASDRLLIPEKLYGRERESAELLEAFEGVVDRGTPEFVLVSGHSGVGKSSVVNELHKAIVLPRGIFISGKFDQYKRDVPYATLAQAFQTLVRQILCKNEAEFGHWRDAIQDAVGLNGQLVVNLIPDLELVIGKQAPVPELAAQEALIRFQGVFRAFLGVFTRKEHPLVLFLDDLQWLDRATLNLLEHIITDPDLRHLLLIGAFRDNEVSPSHPLVMTLDSIRKSHVLVRDILLHPLSLDDVGRLVADTLRQERTRTESLARLVHEKTAGNPFFTIQFLTALADEHLVEFDRREAAWRYDTDRIRAARSTDNVVDLVVRKLNRLPDKTLEILKQLASFGNSGEVAILTMVQGGSEEELHSNLLEAVRGGFVVRLSGSYNFVHDRVQEAAYSLISEELRAQVHLRIGRLLMARLPADEIAHNIFHVVNQLNRGAALISDANEKQRVAELNVLAGKKAKASAAYAAACGYLFIAMTLVGHEYWKSWYDLASSLWLERAECEFLSGNFGEAETLISELLVRSASIIDKAAVYCLRIDLNVMKSEEPRAVASALECLRLFGIEMSAHPSSEQVQAQYEKVLRNLDGRSIESLRDLPLMNDPKMQAAMRVLSVLYGPAFTTDNNLFYLCACHMANISLNCGITDASAHGLALFGRVLGPLLHRYRDGYLFGKLGIDLAEKHGFMAYRAKVYFITALAAVWTQPITNVIELVRAALRAGVETGDLVYVCYCYDHLVAYLLIRGADLDEVRCESEKALDFLHKSKFLEGADRMVSQRQFIRYMQGRTTTFSSFSDADFDEAGFEAHLTAEADRMSTVTCWHWILKLQAGFFSGNYESAMEAAQRANVLLWATAGCIQLLDYHYYTGLAIAAVFKTTPPDSQSERREALMAHVEQLRDWAEHCSVTFKDKYTLILAEVARIEGRDLDAMHLYQQAIHFARENGFVQNEAIANEVAARFFLARGFETIGHAYLRNARSCYLRWGALAKVKQLDELYPVLQEQPLSATGTMGASTKGLDLTTVVKALQAVSHEIDRGKLIESLMVIAIEHAGAEQGLLFLSREQEYEIAAEAKTLGNTVQVLFPQAFVTLPKFPESVLRYVTRTQESVILDDARATNRFSDDAYVLQKRPRSILCLPLVKRRELIGVLYLENNLAARIFTPARLAVLELLASQAAISLRNALLYSDLQLENSERRKAEEDLRQSTTELSRMQEEVRQASRAMMIGELTASLAHEVNQPLAAIMNNAQAASRFLAVKKPNLRDVKDCLQDIIQDDARAIETIKNVRALFQRDEVEMSSVDFLRLVRDVERIIRPDATAKNISVRLALPASLPAIVGNRTQLIQALINLIVNAFDAICQNGEGPREVHLSVTQREPGWVHIAVRDSGEGIAPAIMPLLFDAFFTTKPKGMGMGLAIVRSIVEKHGGRLWATSNPDRGATLEFSLPADASGTN